MKFSSFALAAVAIAASSVNAFSAPKIVGRVAQVCNFVSTEDRERTDHDRIDTILSIFVRSCLPYWDSLKCLMIPRQNI